MTTEFASLDDALAHYWDLMLTDPAQTLAGVDALLTSTPKDHERYPHIEFYRACCFIYLGQLTRAEASLETLLIDAESKNDPQQQRRVLNSLGMVKKSLGQFDGAVRALEKSAELCIQFNTPEQEIPVRLNLANLFIELDDLETAEQQLTQVFHLPIANISDEWLGELEFLKARILLAKYDYSGTRDSIQNALSVAEKLGYHHLRVNSLTILGRLQRIQGQQEDAIATLQKAITDPDFENEGVLGAMAYIELIKALLSLQRFDDARKSLATAQAMLTSETNSKYQSQLTELEAVLSASQGNFEQAYSALQKASQLKQSLNSEQIKNSVAIERYQREKSELQAEQQLAQRENALLKATQQKLEIVNEFARALASTRDIGELGMAVYKLMNAHFDAHVIAIATNDEAHRCITYLSIVENSKTMPLYCLPYGLQNSRAIKTVETGEPQIYHAENPVIVGGDPDLQPRSQLFLPLVLNDEVMGVLSTQSVHENYYHGETLELILAIAPFLTLAVDNARSHEYVFELNKQLRLEKEAIETAQAQIEHLANHDMLTDLPNRRALDEKLDQLIESDQAYAFAYIDLDGFKPINDQYGHAVGDAVLKVISQRMRNTLRQTDFAARIGGDEFVLILFQESMGKALHKAIERLLDCIRQPIAIDDLVLKLNASIGVVTHDQPVNNRTELLHFSDQAMYEAKRSGKGGVFFHNL